MTQNTTQDGAAVHHDLMAETIVDQAHIDSIAASFAVFKGHPNTASVYHNNQQRLEKFLSVLKKANAGNYASELATRLAAYVAEGKQADNVAQFFTSKGAADRFNAILPPSNALYNIEHPVAAVFRQNEYILIQGLNFDINRLSPVEQRLLWWQHMDFMPLYEACWSMASVLSNWSHLQSPYSLGIMPPFTPAPSADQKEVETPSSVDI